MMNFKWENTPFRVKDGSGYPFCGAASKKIATNSLTAP